MMTLAWVVSCAGGWKVVEILLLCDKARTGGGAGGKKCKVRELVVRGRYKGDVIVQTLGAAGLVDVDERVEGKSEIRTTSSVCALVVRYTYVSA
jgi:hypothetical protein